MRGRVLIYNDEKKFGFVKGQDGKKYFFHLDDWIIKEEPRKGFIIEFGTICIYLYKYKSIYIYIYPTSSFAAFIASVHSRTVWGYLE